MLSKPPATKPRRNWHLVRWTIVAILAILGWNAWTAYDEGQATKLARGLGWRFTVEEHIETIRYDWRNIFRKETWQAGRRELTIPSDRQFEGLIDLIRRLRPTALSISLTHRYRDLSELKGLSNLSELYLGNCPNLANIDALRELKGLTLLAIEEAPVFSNFDGLKGLKNLKDLRLHNCSLLTNLDALRDLKSLERLSIEKCRQLTNVDGLLGHPNLNYAGFLDCTALPPKELDRLKAEKPSIFKVIPRY